MKRSRTIPCLCTLLLAAAAMGATTQTAVPASIVLPSRVVAEQAATLAVLDSAGALLPGAVVEFAGGERVTTDATGRAVFTVPALAQGVQTGVLRVQLAGAPTAVTETAMVFPPSAAAPTVVLRDPPLMVAIGDRVALSGTGFHGISDNTQVWLREERALLLAASPVSLVILAGPRTAPGPTTLFVEVEGRRSAPHAMTLLAIEFSTDRAGLAPKEKGTLSVRVRGTEQRVELEARNLAPDVVKLAGQGRGRESFRFLTSGGAENMAVLPLEGRRAGNFSVSVRLIPVAAGLPDTEAARQKLLAAKRVAPAAWRKRIDSVIQRLEKSPQNAVAARNELEKMLALQPGGDFGMLIQEAWHILLNLP